MLGKLLVALGPDNILWGTDSIWYGSPQGQIEAFRAFEITPEYQERFGYPALTADVKARILGLNAARVYGIDPATTTCALSAADRSGLPRRGTRSRPDRPDHGRRGAGHVRRRPPLVRVSPIDKFASVPPHTASIQPRRSHAPYSARRRRVGSGASGLGVDRAGSRTGPVRTATTSVRMVWSRAAAGMSPTWGRRVDGGIWAHHDRPRSRSWRRIWDVPDGGDLVVAILFCGSAIVAVTMIVAVLGDSMCKARVSSAARLAAEDAAREVSPDRAMRAAERAAAETLTGLDRFGRPLIVVDVSRFQSAGLVEVTVACTVSPRSIGPIDRARAAAPSHRLGIDPPRPVAALTSPRRRRSRPCAARPGRLPSVGWTRLRRSTTWQSSGATRPARRLRTSRCRERRSPLA